MKKIEMDKISSKLGVFRFASIKEKIDKSFIRPLRTMIRTIQMGPDGTLSAWCEDEDFIIQNQQRPINILARFANKESGDFMVIEGHSRIAALAPGKGALVHIIPSNTNILER